MKAEEEARKLREQEFEQKLAALAEKVQLFPRKALQNRNFVRTAEIFSTPNFLVCVCVCVCVLKPSKQSIFMYTNRKGFFGFFFPLMCMFF